MTLPSNVDDYLHRSGRTGRQGRSGKVVTLTHSKEQFVLRRYMNELGIDIHARVLLRPIMSSQPAVAAQMLIP